MREAIALVQEKGLTNRVAIHQGAIEAIPLEAASVDHIWCRDMLNHLPDLRRGLAECRRCRGPAARC
ncbi:MAG: methyltransferase domain-containing protein [Caldilineaceae bacterium]